MNATYNNLKKLILMGKKSKEDILEMMDVFLMADRISAEQYAELFAMLQ